MLPGHDFLNQLRADRLQREADRPQPSGSIYDGIVQGKPQIKRLGGGVTPAEGYLSTKSLQKGSTVAVRGRHFDAAPASEVETINPARASPPIFAALLKITEAGTEKYWLAHKGDRILLNPTQGPSLTWAQSDPINSPDTSTPSPNGESIYTEGEVSGDGLVSSLYETYVTLTEPTTVRPYSSGTVSSDGGGEVTFSGSMTIEVESPIDGWVNAISVGGDFEGFSLFDFSAQGLDLPAFEVQATEQSAPGVYPASDEPTVTITRWGIAIASPTYYLFPPGNYRFTSEIFLYATSFEFDGVTPTATPHTTTSFSWTNHIIVDGGFPGGIPHLSYGLQWHAGLVAENYGMLYRSQSDQDATIALHPATITPSPDDWRGDRMAYPPLPPPGPSCAGVYQGNDFANLYGGKLYTVDPAQQIGDGMGGTEDLAIAALSRSVNGSVQVRTAVDDGSGNCQISGGIQTKKIRLSKLLVGPLESVNPTDAQVVAIAVRS